MKDKSIYQNAVKFVARYLLIVLASSPVLLVSQKDFLQERQAMVEYQIEKRGIQHQATLEAMRQVKRHLFVEQDQVDRAYSDSPLPIGYGQTISQPYIVAYMTEAINPTADFRVLEIGTGSGYQAAVLAEIVDSVFSIEIIEPLAKSASARLKKLNYTNVNLRQADGYFGWEEKAPFDAIIVTAAADFIPPPLVTQLKEGGTMIIPVGSPFSTQSLMLVNIENGQIKTRSLIPVRFVPFTRN